MASSDKHCSRARPRRLGLTLQNAVRCPLSCSFAGVDPAPAATHFSETEIIWPKKALGSEPFRLTFLRDAKPQDGSYAWGPAPQVLSFPGGMPWSRASSAARWDRQLQGGLSTALRRRFSPDALIEAAADRFGLEPEDFVSTLAKELYTDLRTSLSVDEWKTVGRRARSAAAAACVANSAVGARFAYEAA